MSDGTRRPDQPRHRDERVTQRRDAGRVEPVVDPDAAGLVSVVRPSPPSRVTAMSGDSLATPAMIPACAAAPSHGRAKASRPGWPGAASMT